MPHFDKLQSKVSQWWTFYSDRTRIKSLFKRWKDIGMVFEKLYRNTLSKQLIVFVLYKPHYLLLKTEVSVQEACVSLACWVGIPVYLVLIVSLIYYWLKYQSRKLLSPLLAGFYRKFNLGFEVVLSKTIQKRIIFLIVA